MEDILEIGKYILPALVVLLTVWLVLRQFFKNWEAASRLKLLQKSKRITLPLRLQAYERISLFLEHIKLDHLLVNSFNNQLTAREFGTQLVESIRSEYDQNCSQQIYLSEEVWSLVKMAKENSIQEIHAAMRSLSAEANALELSQSLIELKTKAPASSTQLALEGIKAEARKLFAAS